MSEVTRLGLVPDLPKLNEAKEFFCGDTAICIANVAGSLVALANFCPHRGGALGQGIVENGKVVCPWHGWQFDPHTGASTHNPRARVAVYSLKIENGEVTIEI